MSYSSLTGTKTNWGAKTFFNSDAGLYITGTKEITIAANAKHALSSWSISFVVNKKTASGNTYFSQSGGVSIGDTELSNLVVDRSTHFVITSDSTIYQNASVKTSISALGNLLNAEITIGTGDFVISHFTIFDKVLNEGEVDDLKALVGHIPLSLHSNVITYIPLGQQYSYKVLSGDTATSKGLSIGDLAAWDLADSFGGSSIHGKLVNYSDNEVGTDVANQENTELKNFYCSDVRHTASGKNYESANNMYDQIDSFVKFEYTQAVSYYFSFWINDVTNDRCVAFTTRRKSGAVSPLSDQAGIVVQKATGSNYLILTYSGANGTNFAVRGDTPVKKGFNSVLITYDGGATASGVNMYLNERVSAKTTVSGGTITATIISVNFPNYALIGRANDSAGNANAKSNCIHKKLEIINTEITSQSDIDSVFDCDGFGALAYTYLLNVDLNKTDVDLTTLPSTPNYTISPFKSGVAHTGIVKGDGTYLELRSSYPMIEQGLEITAGKTINFGNLGTIQAINFSLIASANTVNLFTFTGGNIAIDGSDNITTTLTGATIFVNGEQSTSFNLGAVQDVTILFDSQAVNAFNSTDDMDLFIRLGTKDVDFKPWMINLLNNNGLLANPFNWFNSQSDGFVDGLDNYWQAQEGSISGATMSNLSTGGNATLTGFTIPTDIKNINTLR